VIPAARGSFGLPIEETLRQMDKARAEFRAAALKKFRG
jgi:hypothetical protein